MRKLLLALILTASYITVNAQAGHLDSTFGTNGLVRTDFSVNFPLSLGRDVLLHPDGSFYVYFEDFRRDGIVAHYMSNGTLDTSYGKQGYSVAVPVTAPGETVQSRAVIQPDGKIVIGGFTNNNGNLDFLIARLSTNGFLDSSFSEDGKQVTDFLSVSNHISALALQKDGKILAGGGNYMARYHPDGSLDSSFSGDGKLTGAIVVTSIVIQSDEKIVIGGGGPIVSRYLPDGSLDNGFGSGGRVIFTPISPFVAHTIVAVALQNDGKIVLGGHGGPPNTNIHFMVGRLNSNGSIDNSFSGDGVQTTNFGSSSVDYGEALVIQNDGKIILAGRSRLDITPDDVAIARYNTDGSLDSSFSADGKLTSPLLGYDFSTSIVLQPDSRILVAGLTDQMIPDDHYFFVERFDPNGNLDPGLDGDGILFGFKPGGSTTYTCSAAQADGKVIAAGYTQTPAGRQDFALARYNKDGSLDSSFSQDGRQILNYYSGALSFAISIQTDGKVVVAGNAFNGNNYDFAIARFNADGILDSSFSNDGIVLTDFNGDFDHILSMALQPDGKIVVAGYAVSAGNRDFALARYNMDGTLDNGFSGDGKLVVDFGTQINFAQSVLIQPDGKIVAVGNHNYYVNSDLVLIRLHPDGSFDPLFDGDGILRTDIGEGNRDAAFAAALQNDGKIVVAGSITIPGHGTDFLIARYNTDGSFDNNFSGDGNLAFNLGSTNETAYSIALQTDGKILVGGSFNAPNTIDFGLIRLNQDGTPDSSFSDDGIATPDFPYGEDAIHGLSISGNRVYAAGFMTYAYINGAVAAFLLFDEPTDPLIVTIPDAFALHNGVEANTVYIGYEPASRIRLFAEPSGGKTPYSYLWSNGATTASIKVSPIANTNYSVTVTDASGNKITGNKMIKVVDVRCGNKSDKVLICHKEHEHSKRSATLCVSVYAVWAHLKDGSFLGRCQSSEETEHLTLFAYPNPSRHSFNLRITSDETTMAELTVWNTLGKVVERKAVSTNSTVQIGAAYCPGLYYVEVRTKNKKARTKLLKLPK